LTLEVLTVVARIYQPAKTSMQSGVARTKRWILEYEPESAKFVEPLMGWTGSSDMNSQVRLEFSSKDEAIAYAQRRKLDYEVYDPQKRTPTPKTYSDNFRYDRQSPWTH